MISVCMATKNGAQYLAQQLDSILVQLSSRDELVITDDCSSDATVDIIRAYNDPRIKLKLNHNPQGIPRTFQTSLQQSKGDFIFLADQDDLWLPHKREVIMQHLQTSDLVISDCKLVDHVLKSKHESFYSLNNSGKGILRNLVRNSYMGCCMAFKRSVLERALPFPADIPLHDYWIGLVAEFYFDVKFIPDVLVYHRRHAANASTTGEMSRQSFSKKMLSRYRIIKHLVFKKSYAK